MEANCRILSLSRHTNALLCESKTIPQLSTPPASQSQMEIPSISAPFSVRPLKRIIILPNPKPNSKLLHRSTRSIDGHRGPKAFQALDGAADPVPVEITWQIAAGALAGTTPFVVAGIEFGKRIVAQRRCAICRGSGLVLRDDYYSRCSSCGGFLPWQSWKRFFTG